MVYPTGVLVGPHPSEDMPAEILPDYEEARDIAARSPRGAAALLRLCVQKLCMQLGEPGKKLDDDIGALLAKGLIRPSLARAMDVVRITGNEAVHPGVLDVRDDEALVSTLFDFVNLIVEQAISDEQTIARAYEKMPESKRDAVERRDTPKPQPSQD